MTYVNEKDMSGKCASDGQAAEEAFIKIAKKKKTFLRKADTSEQKRFIDLFLDVKGKILKVDVKSQKNLKRGSEDKERPIWIEFKNVYGGRGWVCGESDFIAFERANHFIIVKRESLLEWCKENIDFKNKVDNSRKAYKKAYTRYGRKDLISYVWYSDISHLIYRKWKKV